MSKDIAMVFFKKNQAKVPFILFLHFVIKLKFEKLQKTEKIKFDEEMDINFLQNVSCLFKNRQILFVSDCHFVLHFH